MSEGIMIAIIGLIGTILGAAIGAFAALIKSGMGTSGNGTQSGCAIVGLIASLAGAIGLVVGVSFGVFITGQLNNDNNQQPTQEIITEVVVITTTPDSVIQDGVTLVVPSSTLPQTSTPVAVPTTPSVASRSNVIGNNFIKNGDFESALDGSGWEWGGPIELVTGYQGNFAASSVKPADDDFGWVGLAQEIPVVAGRGYSYTAWLNWQNAAQVHLKIIWLDSSRSELSSSFVMPGIDGTSSGWVNRGGIATAPAGAVIARLFIWHGIVNGTTEVPGSTVWVDEVVFAEVN